MRAPIAIRIASDHVIVIHSPGLQAREKQPSRIGGFVLGQLEGVPPADGPVADVHRRGRRQADLEVNGADVVCVDTDFLNRDERKDGLRAGGAAVPARREHGE